MLLFVVQTHASQIFRMIHYTYFKVSLFLLMTILEYFCYGFELYTY